MQRKINWNMRRPLTDMSIEVHCKEFLHNGDAGVFLVALSEQILTAAEDVSHVTSTLLLDQYEPILVKLGWDVLSLLTHHLHPSQRHCWDVINKIVTVCSPKEMTLALLEQMETLSAQNNAHALFMMLKPLQTVLVRLENERVVDSALHSVGRLLHLHYTTLNNTKEKTGKKERECLCSDEKRTLESGGDDSSYTQSKEQTDEHSSELPECSGTMKMNVSDGNTEMEKFTSKEENTEEEFTIHQAIDFVLQFLHPFVNQLHIQYMRDGMRIEYWNQKQKECTSILIHMLDQPLVTHDVDENSDRRKEKSREMAGSIMHFITMCHCGCVRLLTWNDRPALQTLRNTDDEENDDEGFSLCTIGLACFSYLLFSEGMEESYYPAVMSPSYTFQINLTHVINLLEKPEKNIIIKGLALLNSLLLRLSLYSLPSHVLDDNVYPSVAKLLTNLMTTCPHRKVRQQSVPLLLKMISCFTESGRHRLYLSLLHYVAHAGVKGLLLHNIKNEVDRTLAKTPSPTDCAFFGSKLVQLLDLTVTVSEEDELLKEIDRIMPALNFLRYLLIRDKPEFNTTGIWNIIGQLQDKFISPLRALLVRTRAQVKQELQLKREERKLDRQGDTRQSQSQEADMTVEVMGKVLPEVSLEDEIRMLHSAQSHMDMVESILVRVEELAQ